MRDLWLSQLPWSRHRNIIRTSLNWSMWHQWFNCNFMKLREYLCTKKNKITTLFNTSFPGAILVSTMMHVRSMEGQRALTFHKNILICVSEDLHRVWNEIGVSEKYFGWTIHLNWGETSSVCIYSLTSPVSCSFNRFVLIISHLRADAMFTVQLPEDSKQEHFRTVQTKMYYTHTHTHTKRENRKEISESDSVIQCLITVKG